MGGGGFVLGGPLGAAAGMVGNVAVRKATELSTKKAVENALKTVLAGKKAQTTATALDRKALSEKIVRALLATDSARRSAQQPFLTDAQGNSYAYPGNGQ